MTILVLSGWMQLVSNVLWTAGLMGLLVGWTVQRAAERYSWALLRRLAPMLCAAVVVAACLVLGNQPRLTAETVVSDPTVVVAPECDDWLWWTDLRCWAQ